MEPIFDFATGLPRRGGTRKRGPKLKENNSERFAMIANASLTSSHYAAKGSRMSGRLVLVTLVVIGFLAGTSFVQAQESHFDPNAGKPGFCPPSAQDLKEAGELEE